MSEDVLNLILIIVASSFTAANWVAAWVMAQASRKHPTNRLLRLAAIRGLARAAGTTLAGIAWVDIMLGFPVLGREGVIVLVFCVIVGVAIPSVYFLYLWWTNQLVDPNQTSPL